MRTLLIPMNGKDDLSRIWHQQMRNAEICVSFFCLTTDRGAELSAQLGDLNRRGLFRRPWFPYTVSGLLGPAGRLVSYFEDREPYEYEGRQVLICPRR